ncbi:hypothetical protein HPP92_007430 [Vanilla planifolia]|uniref:Remorin C-terminal domain-containing protein n=1 Tax=Vanilla planifolia TaxID=51239 RepID=A0A835V5W3_VANPL|nr:hypothetical protein HPP92_007430 [Vanilla planifolia]
MVMVMTRRKHTLDYSSACSSNRKRLDHRFRTRSNNTRCSAAVAAAKSSAYSLSQDYDDIAALSEVSEEGHVRNGPVVEDDSPPMPRRRSVAAGNSSELRKVMAAMDRCRVQESSLGSCAAWTVDSLLERQPPTPSPICSSPVSSLTSEICCASQLRSTDNSLATANHLSVDSSCITSSAAKRSSAPVETAACPSELGMLTLDKNPFPFVKRERGVPSRRSRISKVELRRARRLRADRTPSEHTNFGKTGLETEGRLPTVSEAEEEDVGWRRSMHHSSVPNDGYYNSDGSSMENEYERSDVDSTMDDCHGFAEPPAAITFCVNERKKWREEAVERLAEWKQTRTMKLMNKLKKKEASIEAWEKKKIMQAKMGMTKLEAKLDKERNKGLKKLQRNVIAAQVKAERKKTKERATTSKKIAAVMATFEKMALTRKAPWRLFFF